MLNRYKLSIITATCRPKHLQNLIYQVKQQSMSGVSIEHIIIQESNTDFSEFYNINWQMNTRVLRQKLHNDYGAAAKDYGIQESTGDYLVFWDDDNIYYNYALATLFATAFNHDVGIVKVRHQGGVIPINDTIVLGDIDTMCVCVKSEIAKRSKWADGLGKCSDYRWLTRIIEPTTKINRVPIIVGEHL